MSKYLLVRAASLSEINNAEYLNYVKSVYSIIPADPELESAELSDERAASGGCAALGLSGEFLDELYENIEALADSVNESKASTETKEMVSSDKNRNAVAKYVLKHIETSAALPLPDMMNAGNTLLKYTKSYSGITFLPYGQKTVNIQGLIIDLRKPENASAIETLGLGTYLDQLETENNAFIEAAASRTKGRAANKKESGTVVRERLQAQMEDLKILAQSYNIVKPTDETTEFVKHLNQIIDETLTAFNMRKKRGSSSSEKDPGEEGDRPVIPEEDIP